MTKSGTKGAANIFSEKITELRKTKGLSQKKVSQELGISQALLSHYENGLRECGLDFVVKIANYYGVSCDFLLGNSNSTISLDEDPRISDIPEDLEMGTDTVVRAAIAAATRMSKDDELLKYIIDVYGIATYFVVYAGVKHGALPVSWMCDNPLNMNSAAYLGSTISNMLHDVKSGAKKHTKEKVPECIRTVSTWVNDYLNVSIASLL